MKKKYLSPYIDNTRYIVGDPNREGSFMRVSEDIFYDRLPKWYHTITKYNIFNSNTPRLCSASSCSATFNTKEEAMIELDKQLIAEGYTLLTQEQYDKMMILL